MIQYETCNLGNDQYIKLMKCISNQKDSSTFNNRKTLVVIIPGLFSLNFFNFFLSKNEK
jgi:hypothetical protein